MSENPRPGAGEPVLDFSVCAASQQEVLIAVEGEDVAQFESNTKHKPESNERKLPDPVNAFVEAARQGMFTDPRVPPWESTGQVLEKDVDLVNNRQTWRLLLQNIAPGAFRILTNILRSRALDSISVKSISPAIVAGSVPDSVELAGLPYPTPYGPTPFLVDYEMPDRTTRNRYLHFILTREPADAVVDIVFRGLDSWTWLLMLGGYPGDNMHPKDSGAAPEPAFLLDPRTIEQAFPDLFLCDDDCYSAVINWAQTLHRSICPLEVLVIR